MAFKYRLTEDNGIEVDDCIYGKIKVPHPFSKLVLTKEMLRLEDITQNGFSQYDYPNLKDNERLSHSVGAFHIMSKIIEHVEDKLSRYNIKIDEEEKNIALCSMLLHDIGHGPFSHALERSMSYLKFPEYSHEKRTKDILVGNTEVNKVLQEIFGNQKISNIAGFIAETEDIDNSNTSFFKMFKQLISHQLDADRLDYLQRDAHYAGLHSTIDYKRIVDSLGVIINGKQEYELVIDKKGLTSIETVLLQRFQMYRDVYFSQSAQLMNVIFPEILRKYSENRNSVKVELPPEFIKLVSDPTAADLDEFLKMTDTPFMKAFDIIKENCTDEILSYLCDTENIKNYQIFETDRRLEEVKVMLSEMFDGRDFSNTLAVCEDTSSIRLYKRAEGLKISNNNRITDLSEETNLIRPQDTLEQRLLFFNPELLRLELGYSEKEFEQYESRLEKLVDDINKKPEEFELKYIVPKNSEKNLDNVLKIFIDNEFKLIEESEVENDDEYFDEKDLRLLKSKASLRMRETTNKDGTKKYKGTYKIPTGEGAVYSSRKEIEEGMGSKSISQFTEVLRKKEVPVDFCNIIPMLNSFTKRKNSVLEKNGIRICLSYDNSIYTSRVHEEVQADDTMIEIEALGDVSNRIILNQVHEIMKENFPEMEINNQSKYERGMQKTTEKVKQKENKEKENIHE